MAIHDTPNTNTTLPTAPAPAPEARGRGLRANFLWYFTGNAAYSACQWLILVVLAKLASPLMIGKFSLGLAFASPILTFTNLQLRVVQATDSREQYRFSEYFAMRAITTTAGLLAIALIAVLGRFQPGTAVIIVAVGMAKAVETLNDLFYGLFQHHEDLKRIAVSMLLRGVMAVGGFALVLGLTRSVGWSTLAMMATWGAVLLTHDIGWARKMLALRSARTGDAADPAGHALRPKIEWGRFQGLFRLSLPLGFVMLLVALNVNIPRYFVEYHLGEEQLGIYSAMAYTMVAMTGVVEALCQSATPKLARYFAGGEVGKFRSLLLWLVGSIFALGAGAVVAAGAAGRVLLTLLYGPAYAEHLDVFVWLSLAAAGTGLATVLSSGLSAARYFLAQVPVFGAVALSLAAGCYLLVPGAGMRGAAMAAVISSALHAVIAGGVLAWVLMRSGARATAACAAAAGGPCSYPAVQA